MNRFHRHALKNLDTSEEARHTRYERLPLRDADSGSSPGFFAHETAARDVQALLREIREHVEYASGISDLAEGRHDHSLFVNRYRNGNASVRWRRDDEYEYWQHQGARPGSAVGPGITVAVRVSVTVRVDVSATCLDCNTPFQRR